MAADPRLLILLNPGEVSRHYLLGIRAGADRAGIAAITMELGPVWQATRVGAAGPQAALAAAAEWYKQAYALCRRERITHVISYVFNGVTSFGLAPGEGGVRCSPFTRAGARHVLLWTDHPNWAADRAAFQPAMRAALDHPLHAHVLKSRAAADEAAAVLGWANCRAMEMAEDPGAFAPAADVTPAHDAVVILSDAAPIPGPLVRFLAEDDPDPADMAAAMIPEALAALAASLDRHGADADRRAACLSLADDWLAAKLDRPLVSFWRLAGRLAPRHGEALGWLASDAARWYDAVHALQAATRWRRMFWLAWLGRRVNLGVYGSAAGPLGLPQPEGADRRVAYREQSRVYALGRVAININAGHDEEGLTHKPFQIAAAGAAGAACAHHDTLGLADAFEPGEEVVVFQRGPELLHAVRTLAGDERLRRALARAMHDRLHHRHTWSDRLPALLGVPGAEPSGAGDADAALFAAAA